MSSARTGLGQEKSLGPSSTGTDLCFEGWLGIKMAPVVLYCTWTRLSNHFLAWNLSVLRNVPGKLTALNKSPAFHTRQRISVPWPQHTQTPLQMSRRRSPGNSPRTGRMPQRQMHSDSPWDCKWIWNWKEKRVKVSQRLPSRGPNTRSQNLAPTFGKGTFSYEVRCWLEAFRGNGWGQGEVEKAQSFPLPYNPVPWYRCPSVNIFI